MVDEKKQEFTRRISQANTTDMVVVIYDIAISYIDDVKSAIEESDQNKFMANIVRIRSCINELIGSLNYDYSPAGELLQLYIYCSRRLAAVQMRKDADALSEIRSIMVRLRDAYAQIADTNTSGPVMSNSENVYAGLTYGRGTLNEDVLGTPNRGFLA
ncbi:MAG: flagellar protein FliS [Lachnospiraceae bacterium]|nr:flagellar protein FliS [Lachnospiraceae bacterium]